MGPGFLDRPFETPQFDEEPVPVALRMPEQELHGTLEYINYYRKRSPAEQAKFRKRVREFVAGTIIIGIKNVHLPDNMRAFIAASAVQLTFGLEEWRLEHFHTIRIYPQEFYSRVNEKRIKGGAGLNGVVWFSWKDYLAGYANQENGVNLGLHEMGHALMINMQQGEQDSRFTEAFDRLAEIEQDVMQLVRSGKITFLRKYAGTNLSEFFAVSMEHFFEQPIEFKKMLPVLYHAIAELLQQDPAAGRASLTEYAEAPGGPVPITYDEKPAVPLKNFRFANWHWSLSVLLLGIFVAPWPLLIVIPGTFASGALLWSVYLLLVIAGAFLFYKKLVPTQALSPVQFVFFLLLGFAPLSLGALLTLNRTIPVTEETEAYRMTGNSIFLPGGAAVELQNDAYRYSPEVRIIPIGQIPLIRAGRTLKIHFKRGLFGMRYHTGSEVVN